MKAAIRVIGSICSISSPLYVLVPNLHHSTDHQDLAKFPGKAEALGQQETHRIAANATATRQAQAREKEVHKISEAAKFEEARNARKQAEIAQRVQQSARLAQVSSESG